MDVDLANDDPVYPNLMVGRDGTTPETYSNGGYISVVHPEDGHPGIFEVTHWYSNTTSPSVAGVSVYWRIPVTTDHAINNARLVVTPPASLPVAAYTYSGEVPGNIALWGVPYTNYAWANNTAPAIDNGDGTWTIELGDLAAGSATMAILSGPVEAGTSLTDPHVVEAVLTGDYVRGESTTACAVLPPTSVSTLGEWTMLLLGSVLAGLGVVRLRRRG